ncbi:hypothetical protein F2Q69_00025280 [Brassica cretica]|uniref:Uncharacterized protein n=1 Tax=Brassica cretica TaxID=69181 RepID=A0A8S9QH98_BRACR|nr:hypothetical protein F2Q69_00025280 [Brassica cretica]
MSVPRFAWAFSKFAWLAVKVVLLFSCLARDSIICLSIRSVLLSRGGRARRAGLTLGGLVALVVETGWVAGFGLVATLLVVVE